MSEDKQKKLDLPDQTPVETVEEYKFEPIKGYPMLNWRGKRPFTSTHFYPAQLKEVYGEEIEGWHNGIYWGDNLQVMSFLLKSYRGKVDLIYIDPPFDSGANYRIEVRLRNSVVKNDPNAFEEKQYMDIWINDEYLQFMYERIILMKELLAITGSIYLHCDYRRAPFLKLIMDDVFGASNFVNEISWIRSLPHGNISFGYGRNHDTLLFYKKGENTTWNTQYTPHRKEYLEQFYKFSDDDGRVYRLISCINPNRDRPNLTYEWKGIKKTWKYTKERMQRMHDEGLLVYSSNGIPQYKGYLENMEGVVVQDTWTDIPPLMGSSIENEDYPTQKPEALIERIIRASSNPGDIIFDCFMGSGTTQAVAMKLGRRFIGADINLGAIQITTRRLLQTVDSLKEGNNQSELFSEKEEANIDTFYTGFEVYNINHYDVFRNPIDARELLLEALEVNRLPQGQLFDGEKDGRMVKIMPVNRIATRADLSELIAGFDYKGFEKRRLAHPGDPVEKITLVCMGHELDLKASLEKEVEPYKLDVEVVDILRDRQDLHFKRDAEARIVIKNRQLIIERFYPMNLLGKLSLQKEKVKDWRELVESVMIDWNYDGAVLQPAGVDIPEKDELVKGRYPVPEGAGTIRVKITDLLSESLEVEVTNA